jgi:hypothetical protein
MKLSHLHKHLLFTLFLMVFLCSASNAQSSNPSSGGQDGFTKVKGYIELATAMVGVGGGLFGFYKYINERKEKEAREDQEIREKEVREWQKVVIYRIFQEEGELKPLAFSRVHERYLDKAKTLHDFDLSKKEISEDALQRVLLELSSSGILALVPEKSFRLRVEVPKFDPNERTEKFSLELSNLIGSNPFVYTVQDIASQLANKLDVAAVRIQQDLNMALQQGVLVANDTGRIAYPWHKNSDTS